MTTENHHHNNSRPGTGHWEAQGLGHCKHFCTFEFRMKSICVTACISPFFGRVTHKPQIFTAYRNRPSFLTARPLDSSASGCWSAGLWTPGRLRSLGRGGDSQREDGGSEGHAGLSAPPHWQSRNHPPTLLTAGHCRERAQEGNPPSQAWAGLKTTDVKSNKRLGVNQLQH